MRILGFEVSRAKREATRFLGDIAKVDLSPGDVCVLMARKPMSPEEVQRIGETWRLLVGDNVTLIVLEDGMKIGVLSPPQAAAVNERLNDTAAVDKAIGE